MQHNVLAAGRFSRIMGRLAAESVDWPSASGEREIRVAGRRERAGRRGWAGQEVTAATLAATLAPLIVAAAAAVADDGPRVRYNAVANEPHEIAGAMPEGKPELTTREVAKALADARAGTPLDLAGRSLRYLDLAGLALVGANLSDADLWGIDLTEADLTRADLSGSRLNRSSLTRARLTGANLERATILRPTIHTSFQFDWKDAPSFDGANLKGARLVGKLDGTSFRGADLSGADFSTYEPRPGQGTLVTRRGTDLIGCDFSGAVLRGADFTTAILEFARFPGADLRGARLVNAALAKADFTGADLTGADFSGADVYNAILTGAKGLDTVRGLDSASNADKVVR
jgi:uncharacterized protein YjbI with pentapeptide repeats